MVLIKSMNYSGCKLFLFKDFDHIFFIRKLLFVKGYKSAKTIVLNSIKMETVQA